VKWNQEAHPPFAIGTGEVKFQTKTETGRTPSMVA